MSLHRLFVIVAACLVACGGTKAPKTPKDAKANYLASITVQGNTIVPDGDLIDGLALKKALTVGHPVDPYLLELDTRRIRGVYLRLGFFDATVTHRVDNPTAAQRVVFLVTEGPRSMTSIDATSFPGLPKEVPLEKAFALVELRDGEPFDYEKFDDAKELLLTLVQDAGYPHVQMIANVTADRSRKKARIRYAFETGPRATFGPITIRGVDGFPDLRTAIGNRIAWEPNGAYSQTAIIKTQQQLYELGRFATVNVEPDKVDANAVVIPVKITVTLSARHEAKAGLGLGLEPFTYEIRTRGGALLIPEWFPLWTLQVDARVAAQKPREYEELLTLDDVVFRSRALLTATRVDMFRPFLRGDISGGYEFNAIEAYTAQGPIARLGASYPLTQRIQVRAGWSFNVFTFPSINPIIDERRDLREELGFERNGGVERNGAFQQAFVADLRDDRLAPRKGYYIDLRLAEGTRFAGGVLTYLQISPDLRAYFPLTEKIVLAARLRGGTILGQVPITERYFGGGAQSHRGFSERQLSPSRTRVVFDDDGNEVTEEVIVGGSTFVETGAELRVPIAEFGSAQLGATLFVDYGDVTESLGAIDPFNMHLAAGVGLSLRVVGIKFRLDLAQRLNRYGLGEPEDGATGTFAHTLLHLGVGETF